MAVSVTGPDVRHAWTVDKPYRVHHYDQYRRGTWHRYFDDEDQATQFAVGRRVRSEPCVVEHSPRFALETVEEKRMRTACRCEGGPRRDACPVHNVCAIAGNIGAPEPGESLARAIEVNGVVEALRAQREANRPEAIEMYDRAIDSLHRVASALKIERAKVRRSKDLGLARSMAKGKTRELVERARQALAVLEMNADFAEDGEP